MRQENPEKNYHTQQGFVLIIVVSILTVIIALIATGFSKLSDRELRQSSNRELSAQAYYAAQSGINDAISYIKATGRDFPGCTPPSGGNPDPTNYFTSDLSGTSNLAKYSCISINSIPNTLTYTVTPGKPVVVQINANQLEDLFIGWENNDGYPFGTPAFFNDPGYHLAFGNLPDYAGLRTDQTGVLRTQIYRVPRDGSNDTNSKLSTDSRVYYLYPDYYNGRVITKCKKGVTLSDPIKGCVVFDDGVYSNTTGPSSFNGIFVSGLCKNSNPKPDPSGNNLGSRTYCNSEIASLNGPSNIYYLYLTAQYAPLKVVIQGNDSGGIGHPVVFTGSQSVIDVTGQAAGQIQRVRARVDLTTQDGAPAYAVQSMETLCKAFVMQITGIGQYSPLSAQGATLDSSSCVPPSTGGPIGNPATDLSGH